MSRSQRLLAGIASALLSLSLAACGGGGGGTVATVKGQPITHADLDAKLEDSPASRSVLQQMVTNMLIDNYAKDHNINITQTQIDAKENQFKQQYPNGAWDELLKSRGLTEKDVQDIIRRQLVLDAAVGGNTRITDKQITDYFEKNHAQYDQPAQAQARHILVADLKTADKVEADLKAGKDFAAEAKQYSIDPGSKDKGGELGWFRKGQMMPSFETYAFSGPIGKISAPVKSPYGYHIIQVEARKPAKLATLAATRDQIAETLKEQQDSPLIPAFMQQLQAGGNVQIEDQKFAGLFPSPPPAAATAPTAAPAAAPTKK